VISASIANARRWVAIGLFRLASLILRYAMMLHRRQQLSLLGLRTALSVTRLLERLGALLALGQRRHKRQKSNEEHRQ
jgi:hypothetical protein